LTFLAGVWDELNLPGAGPGMGLPGILGDLLDCRCDYVDAFPPAKLVVTLKCTILKFRRWTK
jgi:hypothetical protein